MKKRLLTLCLALALLGTLAVPAAAIGDMGVAGQPNILCANGVIDQNSSLWTWGKYLYGNLGDGSIKGTATRPVKVMDDVKAVSRGFECTAAIKNDGTLWMCGFAPSLKIKTTEELITLPVQVMDNVAAVSCGSHHVAVIKTDGTLWTWGTKYAAPALGTGSSACPDTPVKVMDDVAAVSCGGSLTAAIKNDGTLWTWGSFAGNGTEDTSYSPVQVMDHVVAVSCGNGQTAAIKDDGSLWMWGSNNFGQLGNGTKENSTVPVKVMDHVAAASCGHGLTAAIKDDGTLWTWGLNVSGELGNNAMKTNSLVPVQVLDHVAAVACGDDHTTALRTDGTLWAWGKSELTGNGDKGNAVKTLKPSVLEGRPNYTQVFYQTVPAQITLRDGVSMPKSVRLHLDGGMGGSNLWTSADGTVRVPTNPTKEGFTFGGWYTDEALTTPWNFNSVTGENMELYAKWNVVSSTATTAAQSTQTVTLNGKAADLQGYTLKAANGGDVTYVKLRDVAALLDGTSAQFNVDWRNGAITVVKGSPYTSRNGAELKAITVLDSGFRWNTAPVLFDGVTDAMEGIVITDVTGGGHTFFKLRDLGNAIGFTVDWNAKTGISIETK